MNKTQKNLTIALWTLCVMAMLSLVASGMLRHAREERDRSAAAMTAAAVAEKSNPQDLDRYFQVPDFLLVDQNNHPVSLKDLRGTVWVADFIFTRCAGICLTMSSHMTTRLQPKLGPAGVRLVSFSVDSKYDTPEVLKAYGEGHGADEKIWSLLTGPQQQIYDLAAGMKLVARTAEEENQIIHSPMFVLVDQEGWIRGYYDSNEEGRVEKLVGDARKLNAER